MLYWKDEFKEKVFSPLTTRKFLKQKTVKTKNLLLLQCGYIHELSSLLIIHLDLKGIGHNSIMLVLGKTHIKKKFFLVVGPL